MFTTSILIPMNDNYFSNRLSLETNIEKTGLVGCQVIVYNNGGDIQIKEWCLNELKNKVTYLESSNIKSNSEVLNEMLEIANKDYVVIIPEPILLPQNWLFELVVHNNNLFNSGISSIGLNLDRGNLTHKLNNFDENVFVWQTDNNLVYGVICFHRNFLEVIGGFNKELHNGFEYLNFCYRLSSLGFWNFYICGMVGTGIKEYEPLSNNYTSTEDFKRSCKEVNSKKKLTIPFRKESEIVKKGYLKINELVDKLTSQIKEPFFKPISNVFGVYTSYLNGNEIKYLDEFCKLYGLNYTIKSTEKTEGITINFYE